MTAVIMDAPLSRQDVARATGLPFKDVLSAEFDTIPFRMPLNVVEGISFVEAPSPRAFDLDNAYWLDNDARPWMSVIDHGDPDSRSRCLRESAASAVLNRVGVAATPIYYTTVNRVPGALRPLIAGTGILPASPEQYPDTVLTDVMRMSVSASILGMPEVTASDMFRTLDGRAAPIDLSLAFNPDGNHARQSDPRFGDPAPLWEACADELVRRFPGWSVADLVRATVDVFSAVSVQEWVQLLRPLSQHDPEVNHVEALMGRIMLYADKPTLLSD